MIRAREGFTADIVNTRRTPTGFGVKTLHVDGPLKTNMEVDRVRKIMVRNGDAAINLNVITDHITLGKYAAVDLLSVVGGDLMESNINLQPDTMLKKLVVRARRGVGGQVIGPLALKGRLLKALVHAQVGPVNINGDPAVL